MDTEAEPGHGDPTLVIPPEEPGSLLIGAAFIRSADEKMTYGFWTHDGVRVEGNEGHFLEATDTRRALCGRQVISERDAWRVYFRFLPGDLTSCHECVNEVLRRGYEAATPEHPAEDIPVVPADV